MDSIFKGKYTVSNYVTINRSYKRLYFSHSHKTQANTIMYYDEENDVFINDVQEYEKSLKV